MSDSHPRVSVIIPNWNGARFMGPCLDSLAAQSYSDHEVIVVDNGSTDDSCDLVRAEYPWARLLALDTNGGYSGGCNAGINAARGDILVMLNNDTEADPEWLAELVGAMDRHPEAGSAATRMMIYKDRTIIHSAGDLYRLDGTADSRGVWQTYGPPYDREAMVFGGCGGAVAYRREMIERIGAFETRYFMYFEDVDLNWRAQLAGYGCVYAPKAVVYHHLSATGGGKLSSYLVGRNLLWTLVRNVPGPIIRKYWPSMIKAQLHVFVDSLRHIRGEAARARLKGQIVGLCTALRWLPYRRRLAAESRIEASDIKPLLS